MSDATDHYQHSGSALSHFVRTVNINSNEKYYVQKSLSHCDYLKKGEWFFYIKLNMLYFWGWFGKIPLLIGGVIC